MMRTMNTAMESQPALLIVESPNKTGKIEEMFRGRFKAMATYGHICDLPRNPREGIGIDRESMQGEYALTSDAHRAIDGTRAVAKIREYLRDNPGTVVYLGTDEDREGESIAAFVMKYLQLSNPKRMRFNAITREKIEHAFQHADHIDWNAVASREARRLIDRIIGNVASPVLMRQVNQKGVATGRVQTAVEALVIERERKIRNHQVQTYYTVHLDLGGWQVEWQYQAPNASRNGPKPNSEYDIDDPSPRCLDAELAKAASNQRALAVQSCEDSFELRLPPSPFYTFSMVQAANRIFDWDAEKTMQVAQRLFEGDGSGHGHITYHRTDSPNIDPVAAEEIRSLLRSQGMSVPETPNRWTVKNKNAQEGREGIRPSYIDVEEAGATEEQRALYKLIRERAFYSQLAPARYAIRRVVLTDARNVQRFAATARILLEPGWMASPAAKSPVLQDDEAAKNHPEARRLPKLSPGATVNVDRAEVRSHQTKTPPRYTLNTLTAKLEKLGIGRPATLATILRGVQTKGSIKVGKDRELEATPLAEKCYDILYPRFGFAHIGYTAELEAALDQIAKGVLDGPRLVRYVWDRLDADCAALTNSGTQLQQGSCGEST
ncbi:type IA DNA topoisomerase [Cupriavidus nantongensis]|nr:type IA DNA topoisomerase [Cupriavidus nantongensis]